MLRRTFSKYFRRYNHLLEKYNSTLKDLLRLGSHIYPPDLTLIIANVSELQTSFLHLYLTISINGVITTKIYDKRDNYDFEIVNYPHLHGDVPRATSYGVYVSQLVRYARAFRRLVIFTKGIR